MKYFILKYFPELAGLLVFLVYLNTMCPTIGEMDSGELATVQATLSIAHPTGYPLFALVGYLFLKLPLPFETIIKLNILSAIWSALTVVMLIRTSKLIINNLPILVTKKWSTFVLIVEPNKYIKILASIFPGIMLGFSLTFWLQSTHVEVHSLQIFLISLIIFFSIRAYLFDKPFNFSFGRSWYKNNWLWTFIFIGLAFANHLSTIFIVLPTILLFFLSYKLNFKNIRSLAYLFLISFIVAIAFYLWMMFRAASNPPFKYGDPSNLIRLFDHVTAKLYRDNMLNGTSSMKIQAEKFINLLQINFSKQKWGEFSLSVFLGVSGILFSIILFKRFFYYLIFIVIITLIISFNYKIYDINEYFLTAFYVISLSSCFSILLIASILPQTKYAAVTLSFSLLLLIGFQIYSNYKFADNSDYYFSENFAKGYLESLPHNAVLYTDNWSQMISPMLYLQNVKNIRRDILIFSPKRMVCFTPYQSLNIKRFIKNKKLVLNDRTFIFDLDKENELTLPGK